jgi:hypothetical protein
MTTKLLIVFEIETDGFADTVAAVEAIDAKNIPHVTGGGIKMFTGDAAAEVLLTIDRLMNIPDAG